MAFKGRQAILWPFYGTYRSGLYYHSLFVQDQITTQGFALNGRGLFVPIFITERHRFLSIGAKVVTAGGAGALIRLGVYRVRKVGFPETNQAEPGQLVVDAGAVAATTGGFKEIAIDVTLERDLYFLVVVAQGAAIPRPGLEGGNVQAAETWQSFAPTSGGALSGYASDQPGNANLPTAIDPGGLIAQSPVFDVFLQAA